MHYFPFAVCGGNSERSVPACASDTERALGKAGGGGTVLLAARDPWSSSFLLVSPFLVLVVKRNALLWSLAPGCVSSPQMAVVWSGQTVRNSFKEKDSPRSPSLGQLAGVPPPGVSRTHRETPSRAAPGLLTEPLAERESLPAAFISPPVDDTFLISVSCCCCLTRLPVSTSHLYTPRSHWPICVQPRRGIRCPSVIYLVPAPIGPCSGSRC